MRDSDKKRWFRADGNPVVHYDTMDCLNNYYVVGCVCLFTSRLLKMCK